MARYTAGNYNTNTRLRIIYSIVGLLVFYLLIAFIFNFPPFSNDEQNAKPEQTDHLQAAREVVELGHPEQPIVVPVKPQVVEVNLAEIITDSNLDNDSNSQAALLISKANDALNDNPPQIIKARDLLNEALREPISDQQIKFVKAKLSQFADEWLFSRQVFPEDILCDYYKVKPGDLLSEIGNLYKVPWQILLDINNIKSERSLQAGQKIKIINGPFHVKINRSTFILDLYLQNTFVRSFRVGLGRPGYDTPTGLWLVAMGGKLIRPPWTDPDTGIRYESENPNYPLGDRWISIEGVKGECTGRTGFALHGTKDPNEIGTAASRGCVRLANENIVLLYKLLMPGFSQVQIVD
ncbi:MAG: L,D-transpeptidase family protein [Planctomycetes bacterium]|nr:L,D-transpeptidase family protein [Planctomycetota bacterium]MBL7107467.1 L,D-transpeptidase family protein [Phycisphaerae bacterium]